MTRIEAQAVGGLDDPSAGRSLWSRLLMPALAAVLVLALGLLLVGLTGGSAESSPGGAAGQVAPQR